MNKYFTLLLAGAMLKALASTASAQAEGARPNDSAAPSHSDERSLDAAPDAQPLTDQPAPLNDSRSPAGSEAQPSAKPPTITNPKAPRQPQNKPAYLETLERQQKREMEARKQRGTPHRFPAASPAEGGALNPPNAPQGSQLSFFEIMPLLGSVSIADKSTFTVGGNFSFNIIRDQPIYLEPSLMLSFFSGQNNRNTTIFHVDGGLRYDFLISNSPVVPFLKAAVGPSISSASNVVSSNGDTISDSYLNIFLGGGLKVLVNPHIAPRLDAGLTFQASNPGLYVLGGVALPL